MEGAASGAALVAVRKLDGGISSRILEVKLDDQGTAKVVILRQIDQEEWIRDDPHIIQREADALRRASGIKGVPVPEVLSTDPDGRATGRPSLLMSHLTGQVVLEPQDMTPWAEGLAKALVTIHAVDPEDYPWLYQPYCNVADLDTSSWSAIPKLWRQAAQIVTSEPPPYKRVFIHRDYHPANVLWQDGKVSGIVDWVNGAYGPAGIDVGHCRVNLALLHDTDTADQFLHAYRHQSGTNYEHDVYWDLLTLIDFAFGPPPEVYKGWTDLGVQGLSDQLIRQRLDAYLSHLMQDQPNAGSGSSS